MNLWRRKLRFAAVAVLAAVAMVAAACSSSSSSSPARSSSSGGTPVTGGTATIALPAGVTYNWIFPFYAITNASVYNDEQFQWLMYRPLYFFGNNTNTDVSINYPLSPANAAGVLQRRQDRHRHHEGLEVVQRRDRRRQLRDLLPEHGDGREGELVRLRARPAAGQRNVRTRPAANTLTLQLNKAYSSHLVHLQPAGRAQPDARGLGRHQPGRQAGQRRLHHRQRGRRLGQVQGGLHVPDRPVEDRHDLRDQPAVVGGRRAVEAVQLQHDRQRHDGAEHRSTPAPRSRSCRRSSSCRSPTTRPSTPR